MAKQRKMAGSALFRGEAAREAFAAMTEPVGQVDLANEHTLCEKLRRSAKDHTYENDEQIVLGHKRILDANMGISSLDAHDLLRIALRARIGTKMSQQKIILALLLDALPTRPCEPCQGDGKSRQAGFETLDCNHCMGTGVRFIRL